MEDQYSQVLLSEAEVGEPILDWSTVKPHWEICYQLNRYDGRSRIVSGKFKRYPTEFPGYPGFDPRLHDLEFLEWHDFRRVLSNKTIFD